MEIRILVGQNIKFYRFEKGMTQEKFCEIIKISTNALSSIENGKVDIRLSNLYNIANALDLDIQDLFKKNNITSKWRVDLKDKK